MPKRGRFLDDFTEFRRDAVEGLRQPMEDGRVMVTRVAGTPYGLRGDHVGEWRWMLAPPPEPRPERRPSKTWDGVKFVEERGG